MAEMRSVKGFTRPDAFTSQKTAFVVAGSTMAVSVRN
jgi:hypothetical protein